MNAIPKKKLCWNCEGDIPLNEESCPYCGVSARSISLEQFQENLSPPYRLGPVQKDTTIPLSPYASAEVENVQEQEDTLTEEEKSSLNDFKSVTYPLLMLIAGSVFFLFGCMLLLFSENGLFTLSWNASIWYIYLGLSVPLLFFGWRTLQKLS